MPLFYFHIRRADITYRDADGIELDTPEQARLDAVRMLSDIAREEFPQHSDHQRIGVEVFDSGGRCIANAAIRFDLDRMDSQDRTVDGGEDTGS